MPRLIALPPLKLGLPCSSSCCLLLQPPGAIPGDHGAAVQACSRPAARQADALRARAGTGAAHPGGMQHPHRSCTLLPLQLPLSAAAAANPCRSHARGSPSGAAAFYGRRARCSGRATIYEHYSA